MKDKKDIDLSCPLPSGNSRIIQLAHGSGGSLTNKLIKEIFLKEFSNEYLDILHDGAVVKLNGLKLAFTTDSYVIDPIIFPGGDIGSLAVNGTINDLSMCGAVPLFMSAGIIIEEGLEINILETIVKSMQTAADSSGVKIITGDTKVVEKGKGDKIFINTAGIGRVAEDINISPRRASPGDKIILSGTIADHGISILLCRENLNFRSRIKSDTAALNDLAAAVFSVCKDIHVLRDPTRGGIASSLNEIADASGTDILIYEDKIKIKEDVNSACEILGLDPLYIANEGKLLCILSSADAPDVLERMRQHPLGKDSEIIGEITGYSRGKVILRTLAGTNRTISLLTGEQLPRIC